MRKRVWAGLTVALVRLMEAPKRNMLAQPGQWVHLHILNSSNDQHVMSLVGTPFMVSALMVTTQSANPIDEYHSPIGAAQRYDVRCKSPQMGPVTLTGQRTLRDHSRNRP